MASKYRLVALAIVAVALPMALATDFVVGDGDGDGWKPGVNYTIWASGKVFYVGDRLVFTYAQGKHDVVKVNGDNFKACNATGSVSLTTGNDTISLLNSGKKWYICGFGDHCSKGQKLVINVQDQAPAPAPTNSAPNGLIRSSWRQVAAIVAIVVAAIATV